MPNYEEMSREEIIELCTSLWLKNADLEKNCELYKEQLMKKNQKMYGKSSEKSSMVIQDELDLFDEADALTYEDEEEEKVNIAEYKRRKKKKYTMDNLPKNIEKEYRDYDIEDKTCPKCGRELHQIRTDEKLELVMISARTKLIIHRIPVYACRGCQKKNEGTLIKANGPVMLFPKSPVSPTLVAYLMDMKYNKGMPLYRIEQSMKQEGILFPRNTYARWMIECSDRYFVKVYEYLHAVLLKYEILNADETRHFVFSEGRKDSELKYTYVWMFRTGITEEKCIVLYVHKGGRSGTIATDFLKGYRGYLQTDDYGGYNKVEAIRVLCHAHVRRKFADIVKAQKGCGSVEVAAEVIKKYKAIFTEDSKIRKENGADYETIKQERESKIRPKMDELFTYLEGINANPSGELYKAIQYAISNKADLYRVFEDGRLELTNNLAERSQKPVIIGRKNSLFMGSPRGAQSSAVIYSLVQTAKENGLVPYRYLKYLFEQLPIMEEEKDEDIERLMPWNENVQKKCRPESKEEES